MFISGILSSLLYVAMNLLIPGLIEGYNSASQTVSELSAVNAPTRGIWVALGFIYTLMMVAFAWGVWTSDPTHKRLRITGGFLMAYSLVSFAWPFAPMHLREDLAAGGSTWSDTMHIVLAAVTVLLMLAAMGFGAWTFGKTFRHYTLISMMTLIVFGIMTSRAAPGIDHNLPTPWIGVWERINIGLFLLWVIGLSIVLLSRKKTISPNLNPHPSNL